MAWTQQDTSFKKLQNKRITTSTGKGIDEEKGASSLELYLPDVKTELIPGTPPGSSTSVLTYTGAIGQTLVVDTSVPGNLTWFATSGYGNTTDANNGTLLSESQRLGDWLSDKYDGFGTVSGAGYEIKVYDVNSNLITKADPSDWLFDYQTGILVFNSTSTTYGLVSSTGPFRVVGYRYTGKKGIIPAYYGGLGYTTYNLGDLFVGAGSTIIKFPLGSNNQVLRIDSTSSTGLTWSAAAASAISTINGLTDSTQIFATGTSGAFFNISSVGSSHTFNIPIAGTGSTGLISTGSQTIAGQKTFTSAIIGDLTGTATTAGFATTANYANVSGYGITSGFATTSEYAYQSGYGITSGFATTSEYSYQAGYAITSGLATTATLALTILSNNTSVNADYNIPFLSGTALSTNNNLYYNSSTGRLNAPIYTGSWAGNTITSFYGGTGFQTYSTGDLLVGAGSTLTKITVGTNNFILVADNTVAGGIKWVNASGLAITNINGLTASKQDLAFGYSGTVPEFTSSGSTHTLNIPLAGTGSTGLISTQAQSFSGIKTFTNSVSITDTTASVSYTSGAITVTGGVGIGGTLNVQGDLNVQGTFTTINSTTITVADKNIELGVVASPSDLTAEGGGITLRGAANKSINWYSGVGWSSSESFSLASGNTYKIAGTNVLSSTSLGTGVTNSSLTALGTITTGTWSATAITALYGGTGLVPSFTVGDILYANTSSTWGRLTANSNAGYVLTSAGSGATPTYVAQSTLSVGYATTSGFATTAANFNVANAASGTFYPVLSNTASNESGIGASVNSFFSFNTANGAFGATSVSISADNSYSINGNSVLSATSLGTGVTNSSLTALGTITTGTWAGTLITAYYGGTGYNSYTKGDFLVGAGSTFIKLPVGINSYVLGADSSKPSGVGWTTVTPLTVSDTPPASPKNADLWFNSLDGGLLVYYSDVDTNQWVEIALGSGIDLSQPVHITNTTASTSTTSGALIVDGGVGVAGAVYATSFNINGVYDQISSTLVTSNTNANQVALTINASSFRTAKMVVQVTSGSNYHSQEILMVHDDSQVYMTEYAMVNTGAIGSTFDGDISGGNMRFLVTPTNAVTTYKIACSVMRI